jgi:squalene synthase HpnC
MPVDHYENFPVASLLLPARLRTPVELIYRFARSADDFADEGDLPPGRRLELLAGFGDELRRIERGEPTKDLLFRDLAGIIHDFGLPLQLFHDLLSAFAQDVTKQRYADYAEVLDYSRRSANPVGRLLLFLFRAARTPCLEWSDHICTSLQIINFLQDIAVDFAKGRVYMPQDELARFGVTEAQIGAGRIDAGWHAFMDFQIARTRASLWSGAPLTRALPGRIGLELRMTVAGGDRILTKIANADHDVFRGRPVLRGYDWLLMLLRSFTIR